MNEVRFYSARGEYGAFSNFAPYPIHLGGKRWPTSEHYFQAQKFAGTRREEAIRTAATPGRAAAMGRDRRHPIRRDWERVRDAVMLEAVRQKFEEHPDLKALLLATGDARIVEHTARDAYWGDGGDGRGRNMLGKILMRVREEVRASVM